MDASTSIDSKTVADFGKQWSFFPENNGYYGSAELLKDIFGPLLDPQWVRGKIVAEIGSGTGRIVNMFLDLGAEEVTAIEPTTQGMQTLLSNTQARKNRVRALRIRGEEFSDKEKFDLVVSIGVLHHIVDPKPVVQRALEAIKPGGKILIWLYAQEGNELYLATFGRFRAITKRLPHWLLWGLAEVLNVAVAGYVSVCRLLPMPMRDYVLNIIGKFPWKERRFVIFDQLNPEYAKYYRKDEATKLIAEAGFQNVRIHYRHGYSWTVTGEKPVVASR